MKWCQRISLLHAFCVGLKLRSGNSLYKFEAAEPKTWETKTWHWHEQNKIIVRILNSVRSKMRLSNSRGCKTGLNLLGFRNALLWIIMISLFASIPFRILEFAHGCKFMMCGEKWRCLQKPHQHLSTTFERGQWEKKTYIDWRHCTRHSRKLAGLVWKSGWTHF